MVKDCRIWPQDNPCVQQGKPERCRGHLSHRLLLGAPSPLRAAPRLLHGHTTADPSDLPHPKIGANICKVPAAPLVAPSHLPALLLSAARPLLVPPRGQEMDGRWHSRATSGSDGSCGPVSTGAGPRVPRTPTPLCGCDARDRLGQQRLVCKPVQYASKIKLIYQKSNNAKAAIAKSTNNNQTPG